MGSKPSMTLEEMYFKFKLPSIPPDVMMSDFEKEVFYTLNFLRTQPGLMRQRLKRVTKKYKIKVLSFCIGQLIRVYVEEETQGKEEVSSRDVG